MGYRIAVLALTLPLLNGCVGEEQISEEGIQMTEIDENDPNRLNDEDEPIIFGLIDETDLAGVKQLVEAGADIEARGFGEQTPMLRAALVRQWNICLYLLEQGADATATDEMGMSMPYLLYKFPVAEESFQGGFWLKVKALIEERGLDALNLAPKDVLELQEAKNWPPQQLLQH